MPRSQAVLQFGILRGLHGLSRDAKLLYIAVLVEPTVNQAGVGARRVSRWAREAEMTEAEVEKALIELDEERYVLVDETTDEILVRTIIRRDGVAEKPNILWAAVRQAVLCESLKLRAALAGELRQLPAAPPPKQLPSGKTFVYADPHAVAAQLDPNGPATPARPPVDNSSANGSGTVREPFGNPSGENGSRTYPRTPGGGGGGGGGGSLPVGGPVGEARADDSDDPQPSTPDRLTGPAADLPSVPPTCARRHALDKPCRTCKALRERWEHEVFRAQATTERAAAECARTVRAHCPRCDSEGWVLTLNEHRESVPVEPGRRCDHRTELRAVGT